jgi:hypothetical protein
MRYFTYKNNDYISSLHISSHFQNPSNFLPQDFRSSYSSRSSSPYFIFFLQIFIQFQSSKPKFLLQIFLHKFNYRHILIFPLRNILSSFFILRFSIFKFSYLPFHQFLLLNLVQHKENYK